MRWLRFGRWPSLHDLDLILDADAGVYERFETLVGPLNMEDDDLGLCDVPVRRLPLPDPLVRQAVAAADGLPVDVFLSPWPDGFSVAAWIAPPYRVAHVGWRPTLGRRFFVGAEPLDAVHPVHPDGSVLSDSERSEQSEHPLRLLDGDSEGGAA